MLALVSSGQRLVAWKHELERLELQHLYASGFDVDRDALYSTRKSITDSARSPFETSCHQQCTSRNIAEMMLLGPASPALIGCTCAGNSVSDAFAVAAYLVHVIG